MSSSPDGEIDENTLLTGAWHARSVGDGRANGVPYERERERVVSARLPCAADGELGGQMRVSHRWNLLRSHSIRFADSIPKQRSRVQSSVKKNEGVAMVVALQLSPAATTYSVSRRVGGYGSKYAHPSHRDVVKHFLAGKWIAAHIDRARELTEVRDAHPSGLRFAGERADRARAIAVAKSSDPSFAQKRT